MNWDLFTIPIGFSCLLPPQGLRHICNLHLSFFKSPSHRERNGPSGRKGASLCRPKNLRMYQGLFF